MGYVGAISMTDKLGKSFTAAFRLLKDATPAFFQLFIYNPAQLLMTFLSLVLWRLTRRLCATRTNYAIRHNLPKFLR